MVPRDENPTPLHHDRSKSKSEPVSATSVTSFWHRTCELLKTRIGSEFQRWFNGLTAETDESGNVIVHVPNPIHQLWIESNYLAVLSDALAEVLGGPRQISFRNEPIVERSAADSASPDLALAYRKGDKVIDRDSRVVTDSPRAPESLAEAGLNPRFTFDNFVVGTTNSYCAAVAKAVAEKPGRIYNPLFFHSVPGLGKTHLLHAIGREIMFRKKRCVVRYVSSETFTNEFIDAIRKQTLTEFRRKYRRVDVLLIDDVHFFAGKDSTQEEFFHTFNELFNNTKQIILASDRAPGDIKNLEQRLVSRFEWGLTTQIQMPDLETRIAILQRKAEDFGAHLEPWVIEYIAQRVRTDIRKLEGSLMRVAAHASLDESKLTENTLENLLRDVLEQDPGRVVNIDRIQKLVAEQYDIRMSELIGRSRPKMIAEARQVAMYLVREMAKISLVEVGKAFGGRDHGTVIHACKVIVARMEQSAEFRAMIVELRVKISAA